VRYECQRRACGEVLNTTDPDLHICKDLRERMARQERAIGRIEAVLVDATRDDPELSEWYRDTAERIYKAVAGLSFE
jgi:hypothetical protein